MLRLLTLFKLEIFIKYPSDFGICRSYGDDLQQAASTAATQGAVIAQLQAELAAASQAAASTARKVAASLSDSTDSPLRESDEADGNLTQRQAALARLKAAAGGRQTSEDGSGRPEAAQAPAPAPEVQPARVVAPLGALSTASRP